MSLSSIEHCLEGAAGLIGGDLDEEEFHLTEGGVAHFVNPLRQTERPASDERQGERLTDRFWPDPERAGFGEFQRQSAVGENDFEILVQAGGELFAANGGEVEHFGKVTSDV
jgi:hypothetical protein